MSEEIREALNRQEEREYDVIDKRLQWLHPKKLVDLSVTAVDRRVGGGDKGEGDVTPLPILDDSDDDEPFPGASRSSVHLRQHGPSAHALTGYQKVPPTQRAVNTATPPASGPLTDHLNVTNPFSWMAFFYGFITGSFLVFLMTR